MLRLDEKEAIGLIPEMLKGHDSEGPQLFDYIRLRHDGMPEKSM